MAEQLRQNALRHLIDDGVAGIFIAPQQHRVTLSIQGGQ